MAFKLSPSVDVSEVDLTLGVAAIATSIAGYTGAFQWGPIQEVTTITSEPELVTRFGKPNNDVASGWFSAANFLAYSNNMKVVRVAGSNAKNAVSGAVFYILDTAGLTTSINFNSVGYTANDFSLIQNGVELEHDPSVTPAAGKYHVTIGNPTIITFGTAITAQDNVVINIAKATSNIIVLNKDDYDAKYDSNALNAGFIGKYAGTLGNGIAIQAAFSENYDEWEYKNAFTGSPAPNSLEFHLVVLDGDGVWTGTPNTILEKYEYVSGDSAAKNSDGSTAYYVDVINRASKYVLAGNMAYPDIASNVAYTPAVKQDVTGNLVTFLDIGMEDKVLSMKATKRTEKYRDLVGGNSTITLVTSVAQLNAVTPTGGLTNKGAWDASTNLSPLLVDGVGTEGDYYDVSVAGTVDFGSGNITFTATDYVVYLSGVWTKFEVKDAVALESSVNGALVYTTDYTITSNVITLVAPMVAGETITATISGLNVGLTIASNYVRGNVVPLTAPVNGVAADNTTYIESVDVEAPLSNIYSVILGGGVDDNVGVDLIDGYTLFQDSESVDIQLMIAGDATQVQAKYACDNIGEGRKDCLVFVSPTKATCVNVGNASDILDNLIAFYETFSSSSYAFADGNYKYQYDKYNDVYRWVPLCGDIAGLAARTDQTNDPWWAFGGYNRGNIKNVVKLAWNPKKPFRDDMFRARINAVVTEKGEGAVLLGDKTMLSRPSAFDAVNVRRLFITIEKAIATSAKYLLFEFNDAITQAQFRNMVEPFLRDVKGRRGIEDFRVVADDSNNTGEVKQRREFVGDIFIKPNYAIRYVQLNFIAVRSDVSFTEVGA